MVDGYGESRAQFDMLTSDTISNWMRWKLPVQRALKFSAVLQYNVHWVNYL